MAIPDYILELRSMVGNHKLWIPGVCAVVRRTTGSETEVLMVQRRDNAEWTPVMGILDPGEEPALGCVRETLEETGVEIRVDRLALVKSGDHVEYPNGDQNVFLSLTFACTWVSGEPYVADDESRDVGWFRVDNLPEMAPHLLERIHAGLADEVAARFVV